MTLDKAQVSKIIGLLLAFLIGLLAVFGYDVGVIQPREQAAIQQAVAAPDCGAAP
jgi:hypothetical protein